MFIVLGLKMSLIVGSLSLAACYYLETVKARTRKATGTPNLHRPIAILGPRAARAAVCETASLLGQPPFQAQPMARWKNELVCQTEEGRALEIAVHAANFHAEFTGGNANAPEPFFVEKDFLCTLLYAQGSPAVVQIMSKIVRECALPLPSAVVYADAPTDPNTTLETERRMGILMNLYNEHGIPVVRTSEHVSARDTLLAAVALSLQTTAQITEADIWEIATACKTKDIMDPC